MRILREQLQSGLKSSAIVGCRFASRRAARKNALLGSSTRFTLEYVS